MFLKLKRALNKPYKLPAVLSVALVAVMVVAQLLVVSPPSVLAGELENRSLQVMNPLPSAITEYQFNFDVVTSGTVGSILFQFCSNSPVYGADCVAPTAFNANAASLASESGIQGFSTVSGQPDNQILLTRVPGFVNAPVATSYIFDNIVNTSDTGETYVRVSTYPTINGTGQDIDDGGIAYAITNALDISAEVPQFLEFCTGIDIFGFNCAATSGDSIDFGEFTSKATSIGTSQFMAATNADFGYNITLDGNTLTSGNNTIPAANGGISAIGTGQFGLNLVANNTPPVGDDPQGPGGSTISSNYSNPDHYRFNNGDILVSAPSADNYHKFTVSYIVNVASTQAAGDYASTMFYICLANF